MKKKSVPALVKKLKKLRDELHLTQKEVADKARTTESAYRAYGLDDRNPKPDILDRIAKALGVRPEYLSAPHSGTAVSSLTRSWKTRMRSDMPYTTLTAFLLS